MTFYLKFGKLQLDAQQLYDALVHYGLLQSLLEQLLLDFEVLPSFSVTPAEIVELLTGRSGESAEIDSEAFEILLREWAQQHNLTVDTLKAKAIREIQLSKLKQQFEPYVEPTFLQTKPSYDRIEFSLIQTGNAELAQELLFRIRDDGFNFCDFAAEYSEGAERNSKGRVGPTSMASLPEEIASLFYRSEVGQVHGPITVGSQYCVVRLERFYAATLTEALRSEIRNGLLARWLTAQTQSAPHQVGWTETTPLLEPKLVVSTNPNGKQAA